MLIATPGGDIPSLRTRSGRRHSWNSNERSNGDCEKSGSSILIVWDELNMFGRVSLRLKMCLGLTSTISQVYFWDTSCNYWNMKLGYIERSCFGVEVVGGEAEWHLIVHFGDPGRRWTMMHSGYKRLDFVLVPSSCGDLLAKDLSESSSWAGYLRLSTRISSRSVFNNSRLACRDRTRPADGDEHLWTVSTFSFFRSFLFHYSHIFLLFSWLTLVKLGLWVSVFCASFSYPSIPSYIFHE